MKTWTPDAWFHRNVVDVVRTFQQRLAGEWGFPVPGTRGFCRWSAWRCWSRRA